MSGVELSCSLGLVDVENLELRLLAHGNWLATMDISRDAAPAENTPAQLRLARSTGVVDAFVGVVRRAQVTPGTTNLSVTVVGGSGRLLDVIPARHHTSGTHQVPAGLVARGIADATGYTLAAGVEATLDAIVLPKYTRVRSEGWAALNVLAGVLGVDWRVLADGTLWMGAETWPAVDARAYYWRGNPRDGTVLYKPDGAPFRPGTSIDGARVIECCYRIKPGDPTMEARVHVPGDPEIVPPLAPYARSYVATVKQQNDDLTLDLVASDPTLGADLRAVAFKLGIPGTKVTVPTGSIVRVGFEQGQPTGIFACDIDLDPTATKRFSLLDDAVDSGSLAGSVTVPGVGIVPVDFVYKGAPPSQTVNIRGQIEGPGHAYAFGVPGTS